mmetsp:Transcript_88121/g.273886  ORF Transcript_88121/g.273886 Transcript_88121/m.273886 type:complete len:214 (+) Transcript_88121:826-1467(+)
MRTSRCLASPSSHQRPRNCLILSSATTHLSLLSSLKETTESSSREGGRPPKSPSLEAAGGSGGRETMARFMRDVTATTQRGRLWRVSSTGPAQARAMATTRSVAFAEGLSVTRAVGGGSKSPSFSIWLMALRSLSVPRSSMSCVMRALGTSWADCDIACEIASQTWNSQAVASVPERQCITAERAAIERFTSEEIKRTVKSEALKPAVKAMAS